MVRYGFDLYSSNITLRNTVILLSSHTSTHLSSCCNWLYEFKWRIIFASNFSWKSAILFKSESDTHIQTQHDYFKHNDFLSDASWLKYPNKSAGLFNQ